ncbi:zinc-binding dehydrogenase [Rhodococcus sp. NPDC058514]|uniref:zinc-binding dehydrogenase n=1 Tax=unclassified Rhodococcus (in: high G+C Gram-positive bacteria) TaxID=192944 RepID=UPI003668170B
MDTLTTRLSRAAVWTGSGIDVRDIPVPVLDEGEILVRVQLATVCGSDLHTVSGRRSAACPSVLGHEAVGVVEAIGGASNGTVDVGDRIVWSVTVACGTCPRCGAGRTAKCERVRKVGHEPFDGRWPLSGSYAQHIVLPAGTAVARIPDTLPDAVAAPAACATATVMAAIAAAALVTPDATSPLRDRRVLICGAGMLGVTAAAACADAGAQIRITDIDPARLGLARRFGGVRDTGGPVDVVLDFSGAADAIADGLDRLDVGGVLVLAGSVAPGPALSIDPESVVRRLVTITGVHNYEPRHLAAAIDLLNRTRNVFPWSEVVAEPVSLDELSDVFSAPPSGTLRRSVAP